MGPDDALRLADWVGGLFAEITPQQVAFLADQFAAFDAAVVEREVTRFRRQFEALNVANLLRRIAEEQGKRNGRGASRAERDRIDAQWRQDEAALAKLSDDELARHKQAVLAERPELRKMLAPRNPRDSVMLKSLILERCQKRGRD
ncbi:MAG TPA: hypothetical protein VH475_05820 [Tepidisphaeraceae bacterium]|jgi:hypothetical protein